MIFFLQKQEILMNLKKFRNRQTKLLRKKKKNREREKGDRGGEGYRKEGERIEQPPNKILK